MNSRTVVPLFNWFALWGAGQRRSLVRKLTAGRQIELRWVRSHGSDYFNQLANAAAIAARHTSGNFVEKTGQRLKFLCCAIQDHEGSQ